MRPTPEEARLTYTTALQELDRVSRYAHPLKIVDGLARAAALSTGKLASSLVVLGIDTLGKIDLLGNPNDRSMLETLRQDPVEPAARRYLALALARNTPRDAASLLSCSPWLIEAAAYLLDLRPISQSEVGATGRELELEQQGLEAIRAAVVALGGLEQDPFAMSIRLGVRARWLNKQLKRLATQGDDAGTWAPPKGNVAGLSPRDKSRIAQEIRRWGSAARWAKAAGISYPRACAVAKACGVALQNSGRGGKYNPNSLEARARDALANWILETGYTGETNGRTSLWLAEYVLGIKCLAQYDRHRITRAMRGLGFRAICRSKLSDWVWVKEGISVQKWSKEFQARESETQRTAESLGQAERRSRLMLKHQIESGAIPHPTPEQVKAAGLRVRVSDGMGALIDWRDSLAGS